jgi:hypothetical protein
MSPAARSEDRPDAHNASVDEEVARAGGCGQTHLATGRTCTLEHHHQGSCDFEHTAPS